MKQTLFQQNRTEAILKFMEKYVSLQRLYRQIINKTFDRGPGIYIPNGSPCDTKWWDIAVTIEDDVIIGKNGCENLSAAAPRKIHEIEKILARKSIFNQLLLPALR